VDQGERGMQAYNGDLGGEIPEESGGEAPSS